METAKIGLNAGLVWRKLNENGSFPIQELARKLDLGAEDTALAIGWLARESISRTKKRCTLRKEFLIK